MSRHALPFRLLSENRERSAVVVKFGGSVTSHEDGSIHTSYFEQFFLTLQQDLQAVAQRFAFVIGGGALARRLMEAEVTDKAKHQRGLEATWHNAEALLRFFLQSGYSSSMSVPKSEHALMQQLRQNGDSLLVAGGTRVGHSTDTVAVQIAEEFRRQGNEALILMLSNVSSMFTADPRHDPTAVPIFAGSPQEMVQRGILIDEPEKFTPKMEVPLDPLAVRHLVSQTDETATPLFFTGAQEYLAMQHVLQNQWPETGTLLYPEAQFARALK